MRRKSHEAMGQYLRKYYLPALPPQKAAAFLLGCVEPDGNPATYVKGSIRSQWMRGHHYSNSSRYLLRLAARLGRKKHLRTWDCYCLGKLIHYTLDAFTYPHNDHFGESLLDHRLYEVKLQEYFLQKLAVQPPVYIRSSGSLAGIIRSAHDAYIRQPGCIRTDAEFSIRVSCQLLATITAKIPECQRKGFSFSRDDGIIRNRSVQI